MTLRTYLVKDGFRSLTLNGSSFLSFELIVMPFTMNGDGNTFSDPSLVGERLSLNRMFNRNIVLGEAGLISAYAIHLLRQPSDRSKVTDTQPY